MSDKPPFLHTGDYSVGYGKPPKSNQFQRGQSGNPAGRPKGAKNKVPATTERLKAILLDEAYREVEIQEKSGPTRMPVARAVMRALSLKAAKGDAQAQRLFSQSLAAIESQRKHEALQTFDKAQIYQKNMYAIIKEHEARGENPPEMLPHPDDIAFDLETGEVYFQGPVNAKDRETWNRVFGFKETMEEEIQKDKLILKGLEKQDLAVIKAEEIADEQALASTIALYRQEVRRHQFFLVTCCLNIMRRWHLPANRVTKDFVLRSLLEKHIEDGTDPENPFPIKKEIDLEKMFYQS